MKTAMQELIEKLEILINRNTNIYAQASLKDVKFEIENKFIEAEKDQIINFHIEVMKEGLIEEGDKKWSDGYLPKIREAAEKYYTKTYKSDE